MTDKKISLLIFTGITILVFAVYAGASRSYLTKLEEKSAMEQSPPIRSFYVDGHGNEKTTIDVVEIDGVEYLVAHTPRGVSICKK